MYVIQGEDRVLVRTGTRTVQARFEFRVKRSERVAVA